MATSKTHFMENWKQSASVLPAPGENFSNWADLAYTHVKGADGMTRLMPENAMHERITNSAMYTYFPANSGGSGAVGNNTFVFNIPQGSVIDCEDVLLYATVTETGGTNNIVYAPMDLWLQRVNIAFNGGSQDMMQFQFANVYLHNWMSRYNEGWQKYSALNNASSTSPITTPATLAAGASANWAISIPSLLSQASIFFKDLKGDIVITVQTLPLANITVSGTGVGALSNVQLVLKQKDALDSELNRKYRLMQEYPLYARYTDGLYQSFLGSTLTASSTQSFQLSGVNGLVPWLIYTIRPSSLVGANLYTFSSLGPNGTVDVKSGAGYTILGSGNVPEFILKLKSADDWPSGFFSTTNVGLINFCAEPSKTWKTGELTGGYCFDNNHFLVLTPGATFSSGTYSLEIYGVRSQLMRLDKNGIATKLGAI